MFLKSLALQGFKSFPEYTLIEFHSGVTAIVGPNGSGKSNVTDAIRWVLGEQSVRTLRGGQMEDVIFGGTEQRRAMSFAEVSMTIDNSDGGLPIEYAEVEITRRLFRSGESEYLINRQGCRLKDIVSLFYDTGLGKDGYSIIGQGQVDHILSNQSEDRRRIFEEAAGIQKHKAKRDEAVRKQVHTEQNLLRLTDILNEVEARLTPLQKQAEKAARWQSLKKDLKRHEVALILARLDRNEAELSRLKEIHKSLTGDQHTAEQNRDKYLIERDELTALLAESEEVRQDLLTQRAESGEGLYSSQKTLEICREREDQFQERLSREGISREETLDILKTAEGNLTEQLVVVESLGEEAKLLQEGVEKASAELKLTEERLQQTDQELQRRETGLADLQAKRTELLGEDVRLEEQEKFHELRRTEQLKDFDEIKKQVKAAESSLADRRKQLAAIEEDLRHCKQEDERVTVAVAQLETDLAEVEEIGRQYKNELTEAIYRQETLQDLADRMIGYNEPVKRLAEYVKNKPVLQDRVHGTVGSLLTTPADLALAIETALGGAIQNIVVADNRTAADLIEVLKEKRYGRATFMPVESVVGRQVPQSALQAAQGVQGYIGLASDLVDFEPHYRDVINQLLGRVFIVRDLGTGFDVARLTERRFRVVTLEGEVLNPGGSVTGGSSKQPGGRGLLSRNAEMADLVEKISGYKLALSQAEKRMTKLTGRLKSVRQAALESSQTLTEVRQQQMELRAILEQEQSTYERLMATTADRQKELDSYAETRELLQARRAALVVRREEAEKTLSSQEQGLTDLREELTVRRQELTLCQGRLNELEAECKGKQDRVEAAEQLIAVYRKELENRQREVDQYAASFAEIELERANNRELAATAQADKERYATEIEALDLRLTRLEQERHEQNGERDRVARQAEEIATLLQKLAAEIVRSESRLERLVEAGNQDKNRLWTEYELTHLNADEWRLDKPDMPFLDKTVKRLQGDLKELGSVNPDALTEYQELKERYDFMLSQQADVEQSMQDLTAVIRELTGSMRDQFSQNVEAINRHFQRTFVELFGGGKGEIVLLNSDDVLTADIEIRACPPGKKLQNMLLLSGGERCLTAIALLFAILALRPTPFCIMDEVEAALDDSNIFRFTDYISRYSRDSQFVLVTHRKGTMEAADRIYGVTMPERGISKILSMQLDGGRRKTKSTEKQKMVK